MTRAPVVRTGLIYKAKATSPPAQRPSWLMAQLPEGLRAEVEQSVLLLVPLPIFHPVEFGSICREFLVAGRGEFVSAEAAGGGRNISNGSVVRGMNRH